MRKKNTGEIECDLNTFDALTKAIKSTFLDSKDMNYNTERKHTIAAKVRLNLK